jgi:hypothetical protein
VDTNRVNAFDFEPGPLKPVNEPPKRGRSVSSREDVFVHEKSPNEVLILPASTKTGNLEEEDAVIIKHVVNLSQESVEVADTDMLSHLKTGYLVVATFRYRNVTIIHAKNLALLLGNASLPQRIVAPSGLVAA